MKRFLSTTAVILTMSGAAYADAHMGGFGTVTMQENDFLASNLIGMRIYNSETEMENDAQVAAGADAEWDDIGEINDIIVSKDGQVTAVVLGVGGFLGIGERDVTVPMDAIKVVREEGDANDRFLVVTTSKEMLEQAPEFDRPMNDAMATDNATNMNAAPATDNAAATDTAAATDPAADTKTEERMAESTELSEEQKADPTVAADAAATTEGTASTEATDTAATDTAASTDTTMAADANADRDMLTRPAVTRDGYQDVEWSEMTADDLEGARLYGANDEDVGEIDELIVDDNGKISYVLADIGGFLGLGERTVKLSFEELQIIRKGDANDFRVYVDSTEEKLEALPEYED